MRLNERMCRLPINYVSMHSINHSLNPFLFWEGFCAAQGGLKLAKGNFWISDLPASARWVLGLAKCWPWSHRAPPSSASWVLGFNGAHPHRPPWSTDSYLWPPGNSYSWGGLSEWVCLSALSLVLRCVSPCWFLSSCFFNKLGISRLHLSQRAR